ncbi:hypothetical protein QFC20_006914 [Naganishia adeliensis]|uniref:Uncharacterized protein n=1 Tax=Naganishia adeliensis TaxID=92952 RepID=A0ACC2V6S4_9TREE|nr:hypothetical protein QFC20_006914 [Naganishia adeliensis]
MTIDSTSLRAAFKSDWSEPITRETEMAPLTDQEIDKRFDNFDPMRPDLCHISLVPYAWDHAQLYETDTLRQGRGAGEVSALLTICTFTCLLHTSTDPISLQAALDGDWEKAIEGLTDVQLGKVDAWNPQNAYFLACAWISLSDTLLEEQGFSNLQTESILAVFQHLSVPSPQGDQAFRQLLSRWNDFHHLNKDLYRQVNMKACPRLLAKYHAATIQHASAKVKNGELSQELFIAKNAEALAAPNRLIYDGNRDDESRKVCREGWTEAFTEQAERILSDRVSKLPEAVRDSASDSVFGSSGATADVMTVQFRGKLRELDDVESAYAFAIETDTDLTSTAT